MSHETRYLIDSSGLIQAHRTYYAYDIAPMFWEQLLDNSNQIIIMDVVKNELCPSNKEKQDWLQKWILDNYHNLNPIFVNKDKLDEKYAEVNKYIYSSKLYSLEECAAWANDKCADPWLIAAAITYGYTIVSMEVSNQVDSKNKSSKNSKNKSPKIPDVANHFCVRHINLYEMMRELGIKL